MSQAAMSLPPNRFESALESGALRISAYMFRICGAELARESIERPSRGATPGVLTNPRSTEPGQGMGAVFMLDNPAPSRWMRRWLPV